MGAFFSLRRGIQRLRNAFVLVVLVLASRFALTQGSPSESDRDAYAAAIRTKDAKARIKNLELFLRTFPSTTRKESALDSLAMAYSQAGDLREERDTMERLLKVNSDNLRGLTLQAYFLLFDCTSEDCSQRQTSVAEHGFRVLASAAKPDYLSEAEFGHEKEVAEITFHRVAGIAALRQHNYRTAQEHCIVVVEANPNDYAYVYPLALAYLNASPPDMSKGLFFMARAAALSPINVRKQLEDYGREQYQKYHGSAQGWSEILRSAKTNPQLPSGFSISPAP